MIKSIVNTSFGVLNVEKDEMMVSIIIGDYVRISQIIEYIPQRPALIHFNNPLNSRQEKPFQFLN